MDRKLRSKGSATPGESQRTTRAPVAEGKKATRSGKKIAQSASAPNPSGAEATKVNQRETRSSVAKTNAPVGDNKTVASTSKAAQTNTSSSKRKAAAEPSNEDESAPKAKSRKKKSKVHTSEQATSCVVVVDCELSSHDKHSCITKIEADFYLRAADATTKTNRKRIGEIVTYLVDKSATKRKKRTWIFELLESEIEDEPQLIFQTIFTESGAIRQEFTTFTDELTSEELLFIHTFALDEPQAYGGTGIAQDVMRAFISALTKLPAEYAYTGAIVLSPAADETVKADRMAAGTWESDVKAEQGLIRSWRRSGFEVWLQGDPDVEGSVTIMGRSGSE